MSAKSRSQPFDRTRRRYCVPHVPFYKSRRGWHPHGTRVQAMAMQKDVESGAIPERLVVKPCTPEELAEWRIRGVLMGLGIVIGAGGGRR